RRPLRDRSAPPDATGLPPAGSVRPGSRGLRRSAIPQRRSTPVGVLPVTAAEPVPRLRGGLRDGLHAGPSPPIGLAPSATSPLPPLRATAADAVLPPPPPC